MKTQLAVQPLDAAIGMQPFTYAPRLCDYPHYSRVDPEERVATVSIVIEDELQNLQRQKILPC